MRKKVGGEIMKQVEVLVETSCNNAPKKALLRDIMIAFINDDISFLLEWLADDVSWKIIGKRTYESKRIVEKALRELKIDSIQTMKIENIITHGNVASLNGLLELKNETIHFCHVFRFNGFGKKAKINYITSYIIK